MDILSRMFESGIVTLREGVEAALVIGVLLAYLRRTGRAAYARYVLLGLGAAVLASLLGAILIHRYGLDPENPAVEGTVMFVAAGLVASLVVWMWRTGRSIRRRLEHRLDTLVGQAATASVEYRAALGVFAFAFFMMFREGVETVLFLAALSGTVACQPPLQRPGGRAGTAAGPRVRDPSGAGSLHINLRRFFGVTGVVLLILVAKLIAGGLHEFFEAGILPASHAIEETVELLTGKTTSLLILGLLIALPALCLLWDWWRGASLAESSLPPQPNGAGT